jgi:hypothetical protein
MVSYRVPFSAVQLPSWWHYQWVAKSAGNISESSSGSCRKRTPHPQEHKLQQDVGILSTRSNLNTPLDVVHSVWRGGRQSGGRSSSKVTEDSEGWKRRQIPYLGFTEKIQLRTRLASNSKRLTRVPPQTSSAFDHRCEARPNTTHSPYTTCTNARIAPTKAV